MERRVAACVVTGFLGSGKTTLIRALLAAAPAPDRIAVIVNELGEIGVDGRVIGGFEFVENVVELDGGCVCCSIDEYRFDLAVGELVRRLDPALLLIETTGAADPGPALERLRRAGLAVDAVVTVVDAAFWARAWRLSGAARRQIEAADFLFVSKTDLVSARRLRALRQRLGGANPRAHLVEGLEAQTLALLLATSAARVATGAGGEVGGRPLGEAPPAHLAEDRIESFATTSETPVDLEAFERFLASLPRRVLRAKGFVRAGVARRPYLFQVVCGRVDLTPLAADALATTAGAARAVFVGVALGRSRAEIERGLAACSLGSPGAANARSAPG